MTSEERMSRVRKIIGSGQRNLSNAEQSELLAIGLDIAGDFFDAIERIAKANEDAAEALKVANIIAEQG